MEGGKWNGAGSNPQQSRINLRRRRGGTTGGEGSQRSSPRNGLASAAGRDNGRKKAGTNSEMTPISKKARQNKGHGEKGFWGKRGVVRLGGKKRVGGFSGGGWVVCVFFGFGVVWATAPGSFVAKKCEPAADSNKKPNILKRRGGFQRGDGKGGSQPNV